MALVDGDQGVSYAQLAGLARAVAARLFGEGLLAGEWVAVFLDKSREAVAALYEVWSAGGMAVPVNEGRRTRQVAHIVQHSESCLFLTAQRMLARLDAAAALGGTPLLLLDRGRCPPRRRCWRRARAARSRRRSSYTSGSTGLPKGIVLSHDNLLAGARIVACYLEIQEDERILSVLPFSFD